MNYIGYEMRPGIFWVTLGSWGYPWVSLGNQTNPLNLVQVIAFHKNLLFFLSNQHLLSSRHNKLITAPYLFLCIRCVLVLTRTETMKFNI